MRVNRIKIKQSNEFGLHIKQGPNRFVPNGVNVWFVNYGIIQALKNISVIRYLKELEYYACW